MGARSLNHFHSTGEVNERYIVNTRATRSNLNTIVRTLANLNRGLPRMDQLERTYYHTVEQIVYQYANHCLKFRQLSGDFNHPDALSVKLPMGTWGAILNCHERTARRHMNKLHEWGFIIKERVLGVVKIYVSPLLMDFVYEKSNDPKLSQIPLQIRHKLNRKFALQAYESQKQACTENQSDKKSKRTTCQSLYTSEKIDYNILSPTIVDKLKSISKLVDDSETKPNDLEAWRNNKAVAVIQMNQKEIDRAAAQRHEKIENQVEQLWRFAYENIYQREIGRSLHFMYKTEILYAKAFFRKELQQVGNRFLDATFHRLKLRLVKWKRFINRVPGRFTTTPSAFFDPKNPSPICFRVTKDWIHRDKQQAEYIKIRNRLSSLIRNLYRAFNEEYPVSDPNNKRKKIKRLLTPAEKQNMLGKMIYQKNGILLRAENQESINIYQRKALNELFNNSIQGIADRRRFHYMQDAIIDPYATLINR